jgi:uncharacterized protein YbjT (DUF2867 family)
VTPASLLVFGATGKTGAALVDQALAAGHRVAAFVRTPAKLGPPRERLAAVMGDFADAASIRAAFDRPYDAVLFTLGIYLKDARTPLADGTGPLVEAMKEAGVRRLVLCSSFGASETAGQGPLWVRAVQHFILKQVLIDKTAQERLVMTSGLDWTIFRPPRLVDGPGGGRVLRWTGNEAPQAPKPRWQIERADVAAEMLRGLGDPATVGQAYQVSN